MQMDKMERLANCDWSDTDNNIYAHGSGKERIGAVSNVYWRLLFTS